jgi:hypothetical protein
MNVCINLCLGCCTWSCSAARYTRLLTWGLLVFELRIGTSPHPHTATEAFVASRLVSSSLSIMICHIRQLMTRSGSVGLGGKVAKKKIDRCAFDRGVFWRQMLFCRERRKESWLCMRTIKLAWARSDHIKRQTSNACTEKGADCAYVLG